MSDLQQEYTLMYPYLDIPTKCVRKYKQILVSKISGKFNTYEKCTNYI